jgi:hypothetical protein
MDALLGDWDLNIARSKFDPSPPMKKYTMKVIDAGHTSLHAVRQTSISLMPTHGNRIPPSP